MTNAQNTQKAGKFVKYWENETPNVLDNANNEIRVYAQHGKVQVYPKVAKAANGIGKGATINLDTFTKPQLTSFQEFFEIFYDAGVDGFDENKRYWEHEEPGVLDTAKNEIRFFTEHGKLQVFPKIETSASGLGRGATINLAGLDYATEVKPVHDAIMDVVESFLDAPEIEAPPAPPAPVVTESAQGKKPADMSLDELMDLLMAQASPEVAAKIKAVMGEEPAPVIEKEPVITQPVDKEAERKAAWDKEKMEWAQKSDDQFLADAVNKLMGVEVANSIVLGLITRAYKDGGKQKAVEALKNRFKDSGGANAGFIFTGSPKGIGFAIGDRRLELTYTQMWDKFAHHNPDLIAVDFPYNPPTEDDDKTGNDDNSEMDTDFDGDTENGTDASTDTGTEDDTDFEDDDDTDLDDSDSTNFTNDNNTDVTNSTETAVVEVFKVSRLDDNTLRTEYNKNTRINAKNFNPELTIALFEEMKKRKLN